MRPPLPFRHLTHPRTLAQPLWPLPALPPGHIPPAQPDFPADAARLDTPELSLPRLLTDLVDSTCFERERLDRWKPKHKTSTTYCICFPEPRRNKCPLTGWLAAAAAAACSHWSAARGSEIKGSAELVSSGGSGSIRPPPPPLLVPGVAGGPGFPDAQPPSPVSACVFSRPRLPLPLWVRPPFSPGPRLTHADLA